MEEARDIEARAIVMALPPRRTGASLFGKTLETVLAERPCRVIIDSSRATARARSPRCAAPRQSTPRAERAAPALLGVAMIVSALARGGGALALGVVLGTVLALLGAGRLWLARGGGRERRSRGERRADRCGARLAPRTASCGARGLSAPRGAR